MILFLIYTNQSFLCRLRESTGWTFQGLAGDYHNCDCTALLADLGVISDLKSNLSLSKCLFSLCITDNTVFIEVFLSDEAEHITMR